MVADLAVESGAFVDQVAAVADDELQGGPGFIAAGLAQRTAGDGSAVDGGEVGVVGLVAGIDGLAVLLGDEGVQDARLEAGGGEGALNEAVIAAGAFDGDKAIVECMSSKCLPDLGDGVVEVGSVVGDRGGRDEDAAVEVGEEELGACLAQSKQTMPKCSGPTCWTRGWSTPRGLATLSLGRRRAGRRRVREVAMRRAS
jgi:hypothetical protein